MRAQIGNVLGVTTLAQPSNSGLIASIVTDGTSSFTVSNTNLKKFYIGQTFDIRNKTTGALVGGDRKVTGIDSATNTVTYSGGDVAATSADGAYSAETPGTTGDFSGNPSINGGVSAMNPQYTGFVLSVGEMRRHLAEADPAVYTETYLDRLTYNDLVFAWRLLYTFG